ncbi:hypothetical protein Pint_13669 [Pistacia integerrima]|uniref:Uncharacterized protein n=1 Tax=Pistacia integerrima TaxID=434235 RepID=A0ACC0Y8Q6_9ROSI|nr:hypothetical protein Pint_13669 [Pistacia integerrima]
MATDLLRISLLSPPYPNFGFTYTYANKLNFNRLYFNSRLSIRRRNQFSSTVTNTLYTRIQTQNAPLEIPKRRLDSTVLLDVSGMMCGGCVARVRSVISSDDRVDSVAVNLLTETAAVKLKAEAVTEDEEVLNEVAESLGKRLTECGFEAKRRVSGLGVAENVKKWEEMVKKKEELLVKSRNRLAFAWTLVALCCGSHASHILHSLGIHFGHGSFLELLHNSYVKGGVALGALLGPGRGKTCKTFQIWCFKSSADLLFDGLRAFKKGSPNMNSLVGFGCVAAFLISTVRYALQFLDGYKLLFFSMQVMLLGFVLLGRSLEERARIRASSDMNELLAFASSVF